MMRNNQFSQTADADTDPAIDIAQWRRDIQTFVGETKRELQQIMELLQRSTSRPTESPGAALPSHVQTARPTAPGPRQPQDPDELPAGARLAQLKQQLADRLKQTGRQSMATDEKNGTHGQPSP